MGYFLTENASLSLDNKIAKPIDIILNDALALFDIRLNDIIRNGRKKNIVYYRHAICYILHKQYGVYSISTGKFVNRHHSTVLNSCCIVENSIWSFNRGVKDVQYTVYIDLYNVLKRLGIEAAVLKFKRVHDIDKYSKLVENLRRKSSVLA